MSDTIMKRSPDDFDWPATIFLYIVLIFLGIGMCFCLRQANRLIPNRFSFPLVDRAERRERGLFDVAAEEEGLLSRYSDVEDEDDAEVISDQHALHSDTIHPAEEEEEEQEEFGTLQRHHGKSPLQQPKSPFALEEDDELYYNPYKDDHPAVKNIPKN